MINTVSHKESKGHCIGYRLSASDLELLNKYVPTGEDSRITKKIRKAMHEGIKQFILEDAQRSINR